MMIRTPLFAALLLSSFSLIAQTAPTKCQTGSGVVMGNVPVKTLVACAGSFADDVLWHLDRVDQLAGDLDGRRARAVTHAGATRGSDRELAVTACHRRNRGRLYCAAFSSPAARRGALRKSNRALESMP